jgi:hypothetical protein
VAESDVFDAEPKWGVELSSVDPASAKADDGGQRRIPVKQSFLKSNLISLFFVISLYWLTRPPVTAQLSTVPPAPGRYQIYVTHNNPPLQPPAAGSNLGSGDERTVLLDTMTGRMWIQEPPGSFTRLVFVGGGLTPP